MIFIENYFRKRAEKQAGKKEKRRRAHQYKANVMELDHQKRLRPLEKFADIGETFDYMELTMTATKHYYSDYRPLLDPVRQNYYGLWADYVDNHGILHNVKFSMREVRAMIKAKK